MSEFDMDKFNEEFERINNLYNSKDFSLGDRYSYPIEFLFTVFTELKKLKELNNEV